MSSLERPRLRRLNGQRIDRDGRSYVSLQDPHGLFSPLLLTFEGYFGVVRHFDGETSLDEIRQRARADGLTLSDAEIRAIVDQLDEALALDGPAFRSFLSTYRQEMVRPPAMAGRSYPADAERLRRQLDQHFRDPRGAGLPGPESQDRPIRAVLTPHIDFGRGGHVYTWAYRELVERCEADVFVILGVAHQGTTHRFSLTRKHFQTPLGLATTDQDYVASLLDEAGPHLLDDELAQRTEHSIEFQVVFLQHMFGTRPFTIVPILVGSFHDLMRSRVDPIDDPEVARFVAALRNAERASGRRVAYIGSIDLAHIGPEFGDPERVDTSTLQEVRAYDASMLDRAVAGDPEGWFARAAAVDDRWRVCGLAATYTMLHAMGPARGRLLKYDQALDPGRTCCVTFASVAYDRA